MNIQARKEHLLVLILCGYVLLSSCSDPAQDDFILGLKYRITGKANPSFKAVGQTVEMTADNITPDECEKLAKGLPLSAGIELGFKNLSCKNRTSGESWTYSITKDEGRPLH